jgi:hypothetical protein
MPLSAVDHIFLDSHGFITTYPKYQPRLVTIARGIYQRLNSISGIAPLPDGFEFVLELVLPSSVVFADIVTDLCRTIGFPNPKDLYWPQYFAGPVARYVTAYEWQDISS